MDITGTWYNELGSRMTIKMVAPGQFTGTYTTPVGGCAQGDFTLWGVTDTDTGGTGIGFSVCWKNDESDCNSVTSWSGQLNEDQQIIAFWLLTEETDQWSSTLVGQDVFTQSPPSKEDIARKLKMSRHSHP